MIQYMSETNMSHYVNELVFFFLYAIPTNVEKLFVNFCC